MPDGSGPDSNATVRRLLVDAFDRIHELVPGAVEGADEAILTFRADGESNSVAWLVWHLTRIQDDHVAALAGVDQAWTVADWYGRFALPFPVRDHGYGHTSVDVAAVRGIPSAAFIGYHEAVHRLTARYLQTVDGEEIGRVVDEGWDPPVTAGVRLISVVSDCLQHLGQAAFARGLAERR